MARPLPERSVPRPSRRPQPSVVSPDRQHALFLWIYLQPSADPVVVGQIVARLQEHVELVSSHSQAPDSHRLFAGVGFGAQFYSKIARSPPLNALHLLSRKHEDANLPSTGGDIFVHAKSDSYSKLFELTQQLTGSLGKMVKKFEDVYGFTYMNGRDLSGFPYGLANPMSEDERWSVAVEGQTGGSYVLTQRWEHLMDSIYSANKPNLESLVGRRQEDGEEMEQKSLQSHVARMRGGNAFGIEGQAKLVRQSMPYGNLGGHAGLFFLSYAQNPQAYTYLLDRMAGYGRDGHVDLIFRMSRCLSGNIWYFPGMEELDKL